MERSSQAKQEEGPRLLVQRSCHAIVSCEVVRRGSSRRKSADVLSEGFRVGLARNELLPRPWTVEFPEMDGGIN